MIDFKSKAGDCGCCREIVREMILHQEFVAKSNVVFPPGFDIDNFPYALSIGSNHITVINTKQWSSVMIRPFNQTVIYELDKFKFYFITKARSLYFFILCLRI